VRIPPGRRERGAVSFVVMPGTTRVRETPPAAAHRRRCKGLLLRPHESGKKSFSLQLINNALV
jgi:hypothetical protein